MPNVSLQDAIGLTINEWFGGSSIDVYRTMDASIAVMASIAVKAGCNTDERVDLLTDHMKRNLAHQLHLERALQRPK